MITPEDLQMMVRHWLLTPPNGYLGATYGSPVSELLHRPLGRMSADQFLSVLRRDVPLLRSLPDSVVSLLAQPDGVDKLRLMIEVAGLDIPVDPQAGLPAAATLYETNTPPKLPTIPAFNTTASGFNLSGSESAVTFSNSDRTINCSGSSLTNFAVLAMRPRKGGKYYFEIKAIKGAFVFRSSYTAQMSFGSSLATMLGDNNGNSIKVSGDGGLISVQNGGGGSANFGYVPLLGINQNGTPIVAENATMQIAVDSVAKKFWVGYEGAWVGGGNPATGVAPTGTWTWSSPIMCPRVYGSVSSTAAVITAAFSTPQMKFAVPTGFLAWGDADYAENDA